MKSNYLMPGFSCCQAHVEFHRYWNTFQKDIKTVAKMKKQFLWCIAVIPGN